MINVKHDLNEGKLAPVNSPKILLKLRLRSARDAARKTAAETALFVGKSRQAVSAWERLDEDAPVPDEEDLAKLAQFYGAPLCDFTIRPPPLSGMVVREPFASYGSGHGLGSRSLTSRIREYLAEVQLEMVKAGALEEEVSEAMALLRSPEMFTFYEGGSAEARNFDEADVLMGMRAIYNGVIKPTLKKRGRTLP